MSTTSPRRPWRQPYPWMLLLALPLLAWTLGGAHTVEVEVAAKRWRREVEIERLVPAINSDWCAQLPPGAEVLERQWRADPSGERPAGEHCRYQALEWRKRRVAVAEGQVAAGQPARPHWPALQLAPQGERGGRRVAIQELLLRAADGQQWPCRFEEAEWARRAPGERLRLQVDRWGVADCSTLRPG